MVKVSQETLAALDRASGKLASAALAFLYVGAAGPFNTSDAVSQLLTFALNLAFPIVGTLIAARRPENPIGWISLTVGLFWTHRSERGV